MLVLPSVQPFHEIAYPLWLTSAICEIWFALSWILDQLPKWSPINREIYLDRLAIRYDRDGEPSQSALIDVFVGTENPLKEPPLITANTVLLYSPLITLPTSFKKLLLQNLKKNVASGKLAKAKGLFKLSAAAKKQQLPSQSQNQVNANMIPTEWATLQRCIIRLML
ncbi:hypothetical protein KIW84_011626 [Lathyrus oleraceus]|uniref:Uncharacterized protein n=1 Tax=Pisum sativum TaxID=3888 RepID=A0A9D5BFG0_PEA|nr:hypothetical protein KIW84_011626 [Pisum sativum]